MTHPTDDEIMKLAGEWFHTGENQKRDDGYYYRSLGTPSNVRGSDLIEFARALLAEQARTEPVGHVNMQIKAGCGDGIKWTGWALPHGTPLYAAPLLTHKADAEPSNMVQAERDRCAAIADDEAAIREKAGLTHPEDSPARDRCFAGARAAANVARGIRNGEVLETHKAEDAPSDATRYQYLRKYAYIELECDSPRSDDWSPEHLDAAIDAAIAKKAKDAP